MFSTAAELAPWARVGLNLWLISAPEAAAFALPPLTARSSGISPERKPRNVMGSLAAVFTRAVCNLAKCE